MRDGLNGIRKRTRNALGRLCWIQASVGASARRHQVFAGELLWGDIARILLRRL
jgi:hypothetical protein